MKIVSNGVSVSFPNCYNVFTGNVFSEEETIVGVWTDERPVYRVSGYVNFGKMAAVNQDINATIAEGLGSGKTIVGIQNTFHLTATIADEGFDYDYWSNGVFGEWEGTSQRLGLAFGGSNLVFQYRWQILVNVEIYYAIQYVKDSDIGKRFPGGEHYSTEEQAIGTWIDGKPLYRKVIVGTTGDSVNTWTKAPNSEIEELGLIVSMSGVWINGHSVNVFTSQSTDKSDARFSYFIDHPAIPFNGIGVIVSEIQSTNCPYVIIVEYTKISGIMGD